MNGQQLKNSILQLAIQGRLVPQDSKDEPASALLKRIREEKKRLVEEKKIKKEKPLAPITDDEKPFDIPESWEWVRLESVICAIGGKENQIKQSEIMSKGKIPVVSQSINLIEGYHNDEKKMLKIPHTVIVFGDHSKTLKLIDFDFIIGADGTKILAPIKIYPQYLFIMLQFNIVNMRDRGYSRHFQFLKEKLISLPTLEEQKRIVEKIEELLPYIEQYDKAYSKIEVLNKKFPEDMQKSILQYAIQGKLVEQRPEEGTAEELYQQIQAEKERLIKEGKIKKEKPLSEITEDEIPFEIPESWKWVKLGDVFQVNPRNSIEDKIEVSFIPMTLLQEGYVSKFTFEIKKWGDVKKGFTHFKDNDIIFAKITPCFQNLKSAIMENLQNGYGAGTTELHVLRCYKMLSLEYFLWFVKSPYFMSFCEANMSGTAGQQRVGTDIVKNVLLPLPPLEEQKRIVNSIEEFIPYCHHLIK